MNIQKQAFTLVEILVAITIFSIMMISVMAVYMTSTEITYKADLNRFMQENVKNIVTNISEDVMKNGIAGLKETMTTSNYKSPNTLLDIQKGPFLATGSMSNILNEYKIGTYNTSSKAFDIVNIKQCYPVDGTVRPHCYLLLQDGTKYIPITNDLVTVEDLLYRLTGGVDNTPKKLTVFMTLAIAPNVGVRESLVKQTKLHTQFTISVRTAMTE